SMSGGASERGALDRGSPERHNDFMEQLQVGYVTSVAAAAGCTLSTPTPDDGTDLILGYAAAGLRSVRLEVQLKATSPANDHPAGFVTAKMRRNRYDLYREPDPMLPRIVVIMEQPHDFHGWVERDGDALRLRHLAHWVSLRGHPVRTSEKVAIRAPREQVFD